MPIYYTRILPTNNGNPRYLVSLTPEQAEQLGAKRATRNQEQALYSTDGEYAYLCYILESYNIEYDLSQLKETSK